MNQNQVDLRSIVPAERHVTVFRAFDSLKDGDTLMLLVDHEPQPLYRQFESQRTGKFSWEYSEQGPTVWQVRIAKVAKSADTEEREEGCCGICGSH